MFDTVEAALATSEGRARSVDVSRSKAGAADSEAEGGSGHEWAVARDRP